MKPKFIPVLLALILCLALLPSEARAIQEEVRLRIYNQHPYDLILQTEKLSGCDSEEGFIEAPGDIPFDGFERISWAGGCDIRLVWSIRYFTGLDITLTFDSETGELEVFSRSNEFYPSLMGPRCDDGVCEYRLLIWNAEAFWY